MPVDRSRSFRSSRVVTRLVACLAVLTVASCATKMPPALPAVLAHPDFPYPAIPPGLEQTPGASRVDIGWRYLQADDLRNADLEFSTALKLGPKLYPARTGQGLVALAMRSYDRALTSFDSALEADAAYVPALVGRGQALLASDRTTLALAAFEKAVAADPSLTDLRQRVDVLRLRVMQDVIDTARTAINEGRLADARRAYDTALATSPDSAFLHRELGLLERRAGNADQALARLREATNLDPLDATSLVAIGELLEARNDAAGAEAAYRQAAGIDPNLDLGARITAAAARAREAGLPAEFRAALTSPQLTRGDLAALVAVRLDDLLRRAPARQVVVTDIRGHWAAGWITQVASAGIIEPFENHTFQPRALVRRGDLAIVASRLIALTGSGTPARSGQPPGIADVSPRHVQYAAVVSVVSADVMPLLDGDRFQVTRQVTGQEAVEVIDRIRTLTTARLASNRP